MENCVLGSQRRPRLMRTKLLPSHPGLARLVPVETQESGRNSSVACTSPSAPSSAHPSLLSLRILWAPSPTPHTYQSETVLKPTSQRQRRRHRGGQPVAQGHTAVTGPPQICTGVCVEQSLSPGLTVGKRCSRVQGVSEDLTLRAPPGHEVFSVTPHPFPGVP